MITQSESRSAMKHATSERFTMDSNPAVKHARESLFEEMAEKERTDSLRLTETENRAMTFGMLS